MQIFITRYHIQELPKRSFTQKIMYIYHFETCLLTSQKETKKHSLVKRFSWTSAVETNSATLQQQFGNICQFEWQLNQSQSQAATKTTEDVDFYLENTTSLGSGQAQTQSLELSTNKEKLIF